MKDKRYPEPVESLLLILGIFFFISVLTILSGFLLKNSDSEGLGNSGIYLFFIFAGSLYLLIPLLYSRKKQYDINRLFRFNKVPYSVVILSIFIALSLSILSDELSRLLDLIIPMPQWLSDQITESMKTNDPFGFFLLLIGVVFVAAVAEEGLIRGFLQTSLEQKGDATRAVLLSAITWTFIHTNPWWAVQFFVLGVIFGYLAWRTNSVYPSIIAHGLNNLIALLFINFELEEKLTWYTWKGHISPILLLISIAVLVWSVRQLDLTYQSE
jgi:membrane protease YdiL (CAAX protease family)